MLNELRQEVQRELARCQVKRTPVLRRSDMPDMLLACDLPAVAAPAETAAFTRNMERQGWRVRPAVVWLLLDRPVPVPARDDTVNAAGETGCCLSLLQRHPDAVQDDDAVRAVVKAAEQNPAALERVCARLHADWAERLRLGQPLPGLLLPYLQAAVKEVSEK